MKSVGFMPRKPGLARKAFRAYYETRHAPLAAPLFPFTRYRRNHLRDTALEPGFDCVSEFWADDFAAIGALMAGDAGATMRADERHFMDSARMIPAFADAVLAGADDGDRLLFLDRAGGSRDALLAACRDHGASLDLLSAMGDAPPPHDAIVRVRRAAPKLPAGWRCALDAEVALFETDIA